MLWYLLYPLRGTTQPPRLSPHHPVRRALYRHGKTTAQHWLIVMLVSVAIAMAFSYPAILLSERAAAGPASHPNRIWMTARPFEEDSKHADVEMRQVWVHGSYMKALDRAVLVQALDIQHKLVGLDFPSPLLPNVDDSVRSSARQWGYHSPLMYWNNSRRAINTDSDILRTVNEQARATASSLNVTLRPASVFAGERTERGKVTAADALVITLMNKIDGGDNDPWRDSMTSLTDGTCQGCTFFPENGQVTGNRVYEFSFTPLSFRENFMLATAYSAMVLYVLLSLRRVKAFHSRFGLAVTAVTQMTCSILASFTICDMLEIDLKMIPQNAYPFVVLILGIENMFRVINAVIAYPPNMATELRIANALGDIGPVSIATAAQNLLILSVLSRVVSPGVAAFCTFACIATLFDAFFLLTFFVAVLNVDIRRFELQDALSRANQAGRRRKPSPVQNRTWFDALVQGRLLFSTRMAGTAVTTTFILSLQYHFFEYRGEATSLRQTFKLIRDGPPTLGELDSFALPPMNASLTPNQWMRMQDFDTAKEIMRMARPGADRFVIRIFAPLIIVLAGADRADMEGHEAWTVALRDLAKHHFYPVAVAVVFAVAFVAVLMNFLLYTEHADEPGTNPEQAEEQALDIETIVLPHKLDVLKLAGTTGGHFVSASLDRSVAVSLYDPSHRTYTSHGLSTQALSHIYWPIHRLALDDSGLWMACHCGDGRILLYDVANGAFTGETLPYPDDSRAILFAFVRLSCTDGPKSHFIVVSANGRICTWNVDTGEQQADSVGDSSLLGASLIDSSSSTKRLVVVSDGAHILSYSWKDKCWKDPIFKSLAIAKATKEWNGSVRIEHYLEGDRDILILTMPDQALIMATQTLEVLGKVATLKNELTLSKFMPGRSKQCRYCGSLAFCQVALLTEAQADVSFTLITLQPDGGADAAICVRQGSDHCQSFDKASRTTNSVCRPGAYSVVALETILGLRREVSPQEQGDKNVSASDARLRRRRQARSMPDEKDDDAAWEAYKVSLRGEIETLEMSPELDTGPNAQPRLYVSKPGPCIALDSQSIAVAFGNTVKVIRSAKQSRATSRATGRSLERQRRRPTPEPLPKSR